jgi:membrane protein DedA with SNARE-associated domain
MSGLLQRLLDVPTPVVLVVVALVVFAEDALFVGFVLPGETVAILGGVAARLGHVPLTAVFVTVAVAAVAGDSVGYEIGRRYGPRILELRAVARRRRQVDRARELLARRGGPAIFLGRWVAFFRAVMPALAGTARMRYPVFLAFNAAGGIAWAAVVVGAGYLAGESYARVEKYVGRGAALVVAAVVVVGLVVWRIRRHRAERRADAGSGSPGPSDRRPGR